MNARDSVASMIAAGEGQAERQAERPAGRVDAGGLADPLLRDRRERVVVELRHEQAQPAPAIISGIASHQPESARGTIGMSSAHADGQRAAKPTRMTLLGRRVPARRPAIIATANIVSDSGASDRPACERVVLEHHLQEDRQRDHRPAQRDLLEHLPGDAEPEDRRPEQSGSSSVDLPGALAADQPPRERRQRDDADGEETPTASPPSCHTRMPSDDAAHADDGEDGADDVDAARSPVYGDVAHQPDAGQHDRDDHASSRNADPPREEGRDEAAEQRPDRGGDRGRRRRRARRRASAPRPRSCRG